MADKKVQKHHHFSMIVYICQNQLGFINHTIKPWLIRTYSKYSPTMHAYTYISLNKCMDIHTYIKLFTVYCKVFLLYITLSCCKMIFIPKSITNYFYTFKINIWFLFLFYLEKNDGKCVWTIYLFLTFLWSSYILILEICIRMYVYSVSMCICLYL